MKFSNNKFITLQIVLLALVSIVLRLADLGYSNLQGDEINALCRFSDYQTRGQFLLYLLGQRKGPVQFLVTCVFSLFDPTFSSELAVRLPFAIASLIAMACFFFLVYRLFTLQIAIYSSFLLAANGIFIAFARIVQYQSFVILGVAAGILGLALSLQSEKWKVLGLYLGFISAAVGLLAHFDAVFTIPPMAVLVAHWWTKYRERPDFARLRAHLIAAVGLFTFLVLAFYLEYALHLSRYQLNYWENRLTGDSTNIIRLFQFYNPGPVFWVSFAAVILGLTRIRNSIGWQVTAAWFLPPLIFMSVVFKDSRTHAYTYLLPLLIVAAIGIDEVLRALRNNAFQIAQWTVLAVFLIFSFISYSIFVDHRPEYPWYPKRVLGMELDGGYLTGTFGFPYSREWRDIGSWFQTLPNINDVFLVTNEKTQFVAFYLPSTVHNKFTYSLTDFPAEVSAPHGLYILIIQGPQSWMNQLWGIPLDVWHEKFAPRHEFVNEEGKIVASVYFLTQEQIDIEFR
jgi:Dolichyl-phosphate-mannose-protein mannosyltransferase